MDFFEADLALIHPSPTNPRKTFPADEMAEMIDSVKRHGVLQPILVRPWPERYSHEGERTPAYELVAGERRYRASIGAQVDTIPLMVRDLTDHEVLEIQIIENLQRKGLHPIEEAEGYELMIKEHGYTADQLAEKIGKSRAYIYGRMKLAALCEKARQAFRDGTLTASTALLVARIPGAALQEKALNDITATWRGVLSHREAAQHIQNYYCLHLSRAAFPQENALLVASAGTCTECPKRTGNNPELYADIESADVCTDPDCHKAKSEAWLAFQRKQAEEEGKKVVVHDHNKFLPLDNKNYSQPGSPSYREILANSGAEIIMVEDDGKLVEAVERKALPGLLEAVGIKPERDHRQEERELERKVRDENKYRARLFAAWHNEMRDQLESDNQPDFEPEELRLVVAALWANLSSESWEVVMIHWAKQSEEKEHWQRRHDMVSEITQRIPTMSRRELILLACDCALASDGRELILLACDCALASDGRASANSVNYSPAKLIDRARACGIDAERIRADLEAEKAAKAAKSPAKKSAPTPSEAPLGGEVVRDDGYPKVGDRVRIKNDVRGPNNIRRKCCGREGVIESETEGGAYFSVRFGEKKHEVATNLVWNEFNVLPPVTETTSTPTEAALAGETKAPETEAQPASVETTAGKTVTAGGDIEMDEKPSAQNIVFTSGYAEPIPGVDNTRRFYPSILVYAHPDFGDLTWTGRGRKPKWVEDWLASGHTLDELKVTPAGANNSASDEANATPTEALDAERPYETGDRVKIRSTAKAWKVAGQEAILGNAISNGLFIAKYGPGIIDSTAVSESEILERIPGGRCAWEPEQSSAGQPANAKQCAAETSERCTKTLELPLA